MIKPTRAKPNSESAEPLDAASQLVTTIAAPGAQEYVSPEEGIGRRIKQRREEIGLNHEELSRLTQEYDYAERKGIVPSSLRRYEYENGNKPAARELRLLCDALDVTADWLLRGIDSAEQTLMGKAIDKLANGLHEYVEFLLDERENPISESNRARKSAGWKEIERTEKLRRARLSKP